MKDRFQFGHVAVIDGHDVLEEDIEATKKEILRSLFAPDVADEVAKREAVFWRVDETYPYGDFLKQVPITTVAAKVTILMPARSLAEKD